MEPTRPAPPPLVSVVVPARNAAATLSAQLGALRGQDFGEPWELVVVDSASTDSTGAIIAECRSKMDNLRHLTTEVPGASRARNLGVRASRGTFVLLCDADDIADHCWVSTMFHALQTSDVVGGALDFERLNPPHLPRPHLTIGPDLPRVFGLPYAVSANLGFRREVFDALGGFDESFPGAAGEDVDFGWRAYEAGFRLGAAADAIVHYRLRTNLGAYLRQQYQYALGHAQVYAKFQHGGVLPRRSRARQAKAFAGDLLDLVRQGLRMRTHRDRLDASGRAAWLVGAVIGAWRFGVYT